MNRSAQAAAAHALVREGSLLQRATIASNQGRVQSQFLLQSGFEDRGQTVGQRRLTRCNAPCAQQPLFVRGEYEPHRHDGEHGGAEGVKNGRDFLVEKRPIINENGKGLTFVTNIPAVRVYRGTSVS